MNSATRGQAGAIVYHGSPHRFDKFDSSKIGTGEGAQVYGNGMYFSESPDVARFYANALTDANAGGRVRTDVTSLVPRNMGNSVQDVLDAKYRELARFEKMAAEGHKYAAGWIDGVKKQIADISAKANVYRVDLPDEAIARMIDYDKPISEQSQAIRQLALRHAKPLKKLVQSQRSNRLNVGKAPESIYDLSGGELLREIGRGSAETALQSIGIPGVRYLDGGSRGAGSGTSNYVVFPGEEGLLQILGRE
jgi:hypothetical protein